MRSMKVDQLHWTGMGLLQPKKGFFNDPGELKYRTKSDELGSAVDAIDTIFFLTKKLGALDDRYSSIERVKLGT